MNVLKEQAICCIFHPMKVMVGWMYWMLWRIWDYGNRMEWIADGTIIGGNLKRWCPYLQAPSPAKAVKKDEVGVCFWVKTTWLIDPPRIQSLVWMCFILLCDALYCLSWCPLSYVRYSRLFRAYLEILSSKNRKKWKLRIFEGPQFASKHGQAFRADFIKDFVFTVWIYPTNTNSLMKSVNAWRTTFWGTRRRRSTRRYCNHF